MGGAELSGARQHVHHTYIWLGGLRAFFFVVLAIAVSSLSSIISLVMEVSHGANLRGAMAVPLLIGGGLVLLIVLFGIVVGVRAWSYRHLYYEVGPSEFSVCSGIFNKKRVHVPYQRIQSVDQRATLVQRIFGVCSVSIDTAGGSNNKAIVIPYVTKNQAENLRRELFARKQWAVQGGEVGVAGVTGTADPIGAATATTQTGATAPGNILDVGDEAWREVGGVFAGDAVFTGTVSYEYGLSNKELLLSAISGNAGFVAVLVVVVAGLLQLASSVFELFPGSGDGAVEIATSIAARQGTEVLVAWAVGGIIVVALVGWALSVLSTCLSYGGFHARRRDDRIEVEHGLLQHQFQGVSVERVQSVEVKQTLIRRLLGYCSITLGKVDAAQDSDDGTKAKGGVQRGVVIHPFVKKDRVPEMLHGLLPEFADLPTEKTPVAPVALRRGLIRRCLWQGSGFWLAVCTVALQALFHWLVGVDADMTSGDDALLLGWVDMIAIALYVVAAALFVLDAINAVLWFRESSFGVNERFMTVTNGGFTIAAVTFPRNKIQFGYTKTNPFQRMAHTASIHARTAAGVGGTTVRLIDAREPDATTWLTWVKPRR